MAHSKTLTYRGITEGDWVRCTQCGKLMLLPFGAEQCPECCGDETLAWADENNQEATIEQVGETEYVNRELKLEDYLTPDTLSCEYPDYYRKLTKH